MAALHDVFPVVREIGLWTLLKRVWQETMDDHVFVYASALSYSWLFAFFPMLIFLFSMIPFLPEGARGAGKELVFDAIRSNLPGPAAESVLASPKLQAVLETTLTDRRKAVLSISLVVALWAASNGISAVMTALDRCYDIDKGRPFYRSKPISLMLTTVLTGLVLTVMALIPIGTFVRNQLMAANYTIPYVNYQVSHGMVWAFDITRHAIGLTAGLAILSIIYNFCPSVRMKYRLLSPGAAFCFIAWVLIGLAFRMYLHYTGGTNYAQTFGPASGLAILLLVFYLYGVVLLVGAELNAEVDKVRLKAPAGTLDLRPAERELRIKERASKAGNRIPTPAEAPVPAQPNN